MANNAETAKSDIPCPNQEKMEIDEVNTDEDDEEESIDGIVEDNNADITISDTNNNKNSNNNNTSSSLSLPQKRYVFVVYYAIYYDLKPYDHLIYGVFCVYNSHLLLFPWILYIFLVQIDCFRP